MAAVVLGAAFVKGAIGFGFPALGTPLLSLLVDVKTAVVVLILPNIVMDGIQFARRGAPLATARRFWVLLAAGALGTILGTRALAALSPRATTVILGIVVLCFVALNATGLTPRVPPHWERWLSAPAGFIAGPLPYAWAQVDNIKRDPFETSIGQQYKTLLGLGGALAAPSTAYLYDWNLLPMGQALWLKELMTYQEFPPMQDPASYNLTQVMNELKKPKSVPGQ